MRQELIPFELLYYRYDDDFEIDIWYYPIANAVEIYYNKVHFDTIPLSLIKNKWLEHRMLGRLEI